MSRDIRVAGLVPAQWFVRVLGVVLTVVAVAALVGSRNDIRRYVRMKRM